MDIPRFLTLEEVLEIHQDQIARYGGLAGVRDIRLLDSAVKSPAASFGGEFLLDGVFEMAAAYLFHLVKLNGIGIREDEPALSDLVLSVAKGEVDRAAVVAYLESHADEAAKE